MRGLRRERPWLTAITAGGVTLAGALAVMLASAPAANAEIPVVGPLVKAIASPAAEAAVSVLLKILEAIFGGIEAKLITGVITALLSVPNFATGRVAALEQTTVAIAAGMLSAVLTLSSIRYYLAGLTDAGSGGYEALQGLIRVAGAVAWILLWPTVFSEVVQIPRLFNQALLDSGTVQHSIALLFDAALVLGVGAFALDTGVGVIYIILIALIAALVFIALLWVKVLISILLMFLYVSMPLAVVLWPIPELSWIAAAAMRCLGVSLLVPCVWGILFALAAAVNADIVTWVPVQGVLNTLIVRPLAGLTLMILCITIPRSLMQAAMPARMPHPAGRVWRIMTLGFFASRSASGVARTAAAAAVDGHQGAQRMLEMLPERVRPPRGSGEGGIAARAVFRDSGFQKDRQGKPRPTSSPGPAAAGTSAGQESSETAGAGAAAAIGRAEQDFTVRGIERPPADPATAAQARDAMSARSRIAPPDAEGVSAAMQQFSPETQQDLARIARGNGLREFAADHVNSPSISAAQRDALLSLGSARLKTLHAGVKDALSIQPGAASGSAAGAAGGQAGVPDDAPGFTVPSPGAPAVDPPAAGKAKKDTASSSAVDGPAAPGASPQPEIKKDGTADADGGQDTLRSQPSSEQKKPDDPPPGASSKREPFRE
jgi:hypothetical protein